MSNIMYRFDDQYNVYGVLNDMDLSSDLDGHENQKATSFLRVGTPPFMAVDLLCPRGNKTAHLYRYDLESLFYVMLLLSTRHQIACNGLHPRALPQNTLVKRAAPVPFNDWFDSSLSWVAVVKCDFIKTAFRATVSVENLFPPESSFVGFRNWIVRLKYAISLGFNGLDDYYDAIVMARELGDSKPEAFNEETLEGKIQYSTFFHVMKSFAGKDLRAPPHDLTL